MSINTVDVALIGGGIMGATLGAMLKQVEPDWSIEILESRSEVATESSNAWNNAGTGHAALCELNYMPEGPDGSLSANVVLRDGRRYGRMEARPCTGER